MILDTTGGRPVCLNMKLGAIHLSQLKPSVCVDAVFENRPISEAIESVVASGISAFEFWCWWEKDFDEVQRLRDAHKLSISAFCTHFISLVDPDLRTAYLNGLEASISAAQQLNCKTLISQVGDHRVGIPRAEQRQSLIDGLKQAAEMLEPTDVTLVIEPLNEMVDHAGYYLVRSDEAFEIVEAVGSSHVQVLFDIYHQQISEGHLIHNITQQIHKIGHFHAAGNPGRHELTEGEIHYPRIFDAIQKTGFDGFVALEYWPLYDPMIGLKQTAKCFGIST